MKGFSFCIHFRECEWPLRTHMRYIRCRQIMFTHVHLFSFLFSVLFSISFIYFFFYDLDSICMKHYNIFGIESPWNNSSLSLTCHYLKNSFGFQLKFGLWYVCRNKMIFQPQYYVQCLIGKCAQTHNEINKDNIH